MTSYKNYTTPKNKKQSDHSIRPLTAGGFFAPVNDDITLGLGAVCASTGVQVPLSTLHKVALVEFYEGASLLKTCVPSPGIKNRGHEKRSKIDGFSLASRRRLMRTIAKIRLDAELPLFVTLTYPNVFPRLDESKKHLEKFRDRVKRKYPLSAWIWKLEPQERGAPHYHALFYGIEDMPEFLLWVVNTWFEIAGSNDGNHKLFHLGLLDNKPCVERVRSWRGVWSYASKYLGKSFLVAGWENKWQGRYWAVVNRKEIPFGEKKQITISNKQAIEVQRYQRRFAKIKGRRIYSLSTICNASQWVEKLIW